MTRKSFPKQIDIPFNLLKSIVAKFYFLGIFEWDELYSEALLAYCEAYIKFDPSKAALTTFVYSCVNNHLIDFHRKNKFQFNYPLDDYENYLSFEMDTENSFMEEIEEWNNDLKEIIKLVLVSKFDYNSILPKKARGHLVEVLRKKGWGWVRIWDSFRELKKNLNQTEVYRII